MKLRNKETGEIGVLNISNNKYYVIAYGLPLCGNSVLGEYDTLDALMQEWEDYEEPKQWYGLNAIRDDGFKPLEYEGFKDLYKHAKELGIGFDTKEEAEKAVEKLKAWKRLKDKGFKFTGWNWYRRECGFTADEDKFFKANGEVMTREAYEDLDLLFEGEE